MTGRVGVAISTTGARPEMLGRAHEAWASVLPEGSLLGIVCDENRSGVAVTKNRCIDMLMRQDDPIEHLFLADDDMYPLSRESWERYVNAPAQHLMLCWGRHRLTSRQEGYAVYNWPRGVLLYARRPVIERVGGMREEFGAGGHEHVEWSRRIHQAGLTEHMFADLNHKAADWFHCEDAPRPGETAMQLSARKRRNTTIKRTAADKRRVAQLWRDLDGNTGYVEYRG